MAFTTIDQLTLPDDFPTTGNIEKGPGYYKEGHTFFYWQDIEQVIAQSPTAPMSDLRKVNIKFERNDNGENHERPFVTGLALKKKQGQFEPGDSGWFDKVALAWPIYYKKGNTESLLDDDNPNPIYHSQRFEGSDAYVPGMPLFK